MLNVFQLLSLLQNQKFIRNNANPDERDKYLEDLSSFAIWCKLGISKYP